MQYSNSDTMVLAPCAPDECFLGTQTGCESGWEEEFTAKQT